ncbi:hypothetical protein HR060_10380 [Catenovulum sp. SM1970]|uniref:hypothetical protein n=1 Tax=Marinifaba aquimaris TaxID=2741323 RepID=UPI001574E721|nr:hypothetical protein [Marinifaba aquimaris]NTS77270.1 hypothetical protein [Marinifaba aquimaris]
MVTLIDNTFDFDDVFDQFFSANLLMLGNDNARLADVEMYQDDKTIALTAHLPDVEKGEIELILKMESCN